MAAAMRMPTAALLAASTAALTALSRGIRQPGPPMPGDRLVHRTLGTRTMSATLAAPPDQVWPWLAQLGAGRGGWYAIDLIDNGGRPSAVCIIPDLQRIAPGDALEGSTFGGPPFVVTEVVPESALVTTMRSRGGRLRVSYAYRLVPTGGGATVLTARLRLTGRPRMLVLSLVPLVLAGHEVAQRVQFARLQRRVSARR